MIGKYAFSFDRETFRGTFNSRQEALKAALEAAAHEADSPATVYVACRAPLDPHAQVHTSADRFSLAYRAAYRELLEEFARDGVAVAAAAGGNP